MQTSAVDVTVDAGELTAFAEQLLVAAGVPAHKSRLVALSLVSSSLRGVDSHGVQLLPFYLEQISWGDVDPLADGHVVSEDGACLLYDAENGIGAAISEICCEHAVRLANFHGAGVVVVRDSNHFGAAAFWAQRISAANQIGVVMCNASPLVAPWQGREPRLGTNPICMSVPGGTQYGWLLDMATTTVAAGKIFKAAINGQNTIPHGWAMNSAGVPTTDTREAMQGTLMPLGGYKGSGLAMMVEILCALLGGSAMSTELGGIRIRGQKSRVSQVFVAIDIRRFLPVEEFRARLDRLIGAIKSAAPASGYDEILVAGEPEWRTEEERRHTGVPVGSGTWERLTAAAAKLGVPAPHAKM